MSFKRMSKREPTAAFGRRTSTNTGQRPPTAAFGQENFPQIRANGPLQLPVGRSTSHKYSPLPTDTCEAQGPSTTRREGLRYLRG